MSDREHRDVVTEIEAPGSLPQVVRGKSDFKLVAADASKFLKAKMGMSEEEVMRELGFAVQIAEKSPQLYQCTPQSIYYALANIGNMGLTLNPAMQLAYLVPRRNRGKMECTLCPSYRGLIKTVTDSGSVVVMDAGLIFEGDEYDVVLGSGGYIRHRPLELIPRSRRDAGQKEAILARQTDFWGSLTFAYSKAILHNGAESLDFMPVERLEKIRKMCVKDTRPDAVINTYPEEWCKKTVLAHHCKTLPKSERTALAVQMFHNAEGIADYDAIPEHSSRSIFANLQDGIDGDKECPTCAVMTVGGVCRNASCPDAIPPEEK